jgi:phosphotriesterase-related protein
MRSSLTRRQFMAAAAALPALGAAYGQDASEPRIMTVRGPRPASTLGRILPHEHVLVDFIGADQVRPDRYDRDAVAETVRPHLVQAGEAGCDTLVECTPAFLGRDPLLLKRLAADTGLDILTNTGWYGAADDQFLPDKVENLTADDLAKRWTREAERGIGETGVHPGFIKTAVDPGALSAVDRKLVQAAAQTHRDTGLPIASHTGGSPEAAMEQIKVLKNAGISPRAWIWVHAQSVDESAPLLEAAREGAWIELDHIAPNTLEKHARLASALKEHGLLNHLLLSHDAGWYAVGEAGGGDFRGYTILFTDFLPLLRERHDFTDDERRRLTTDNPQRAFALGQRRR